eukprot:721412-Heterocapsa_arctica.AAC.1
MFSTRHTILHGVRVHARHKRDAPVPDAPRRASSARVVTPDIQGVVILHLELVPAVASDAIVQVVHVLTPCSSGRRRGRPPRSTTGVATTLSCGAAEW